MMPCSKLLSDDKTIRDMTGRIFAEVSTGDYADGRAFVAELVRR